MKVFISWSGNRSKRVANLIDEWLQCVIQAIEPWISTKHIENGSIWNNEINSTLEEVKVGIVCLSASNHNNPWILFESGALAKGLEKNRVCTFLIDIEPAEVKPPLSQFNHTFPEKESMFKLISMLNGMLEGKQIKPKVLEEIFNTYWPSFDAQFKDILEETSDDHNHIEKRSEEDILYELLTTTRLLHKRMDTIERNSISHSNNLKSEKQGTRLSKISYGDFKKNLSELSKKEYMKFFENDDIDQGDIG